MEGRLSLRILVTNDDGIYAPGLWALAQELRQIGDILVVAPEQDQTGAGTSVSLTQPVKLTKVKPAIPGIETYAIKGTPADSALLALGLVAKDRIDLVVSGINRGANLGYDILISGTVGAAFQGYFHRLPAIAISVLYATEARFDVAAKLGALLAQRFFDKALPEGLLLNINLPSLPIEEINGIEVTRLSQRSYRGDIKKEHAGRGKRGYYRIVRDRPQGDEEPGTDIWALGKGMISITPLHGNLTGVSTPSLEELCQPLFLGLRQGLT
jgi:5'-nucleotidase